jgi:hypothetical protein
MRGLDAVHAGVMIVVLKRRRTGPDRLLFAIAVGARCARSPSGAGQSAAESSFLLSGMQAFPYESRLLLLLGLAGVFGRGCPQDQARGA